MKPDVQEFVKMVYQDVGFEDITSNALILEDSIINAHIITRQGGILAGSDLASAVLDEFSINTTRKKSDGDVIFEEDVIMEMSGDARTILTIERTVLNIMMRMSGIASITSQLVEKIQQVDEKILLAGTRKTTPGLQFLEKSAIKTGGGDTHRYRLDDCVLIKDNHIALVGDVKTAVEMARKNVSFTKKIEVEVESTKEALNGAMAGADIIMLDNMNPGEVKNVLSALENKDLRKKVLIEVSGGINPDNILEYAKTGVDIISTGYITHSAQSLDMSLEIIP